MKRKVLREEPVRLPQENTIDLFEEMMTEEQELRAVGLIDRLFAGGVKEVTLRDVMNVLKADPNLFRVCLMPDEMEDLEKEEQEWCTMILIATIRDLIFEEGTSVTQKRIKEKLPPWPADLRLSEDWFVYNGFELSARRVFYTNPDYDIIRIFVGRKTESPLRFFETPIPDRRFSSEEERTRLFQFLQAKADENRARLLALQKAKLEEKAKQADMVGQRSFD